jgi:7-carboxy-7-deazaguanine synthase
MNSKPQFNQSNGTNKSHGSTSFAYLTEIFDSFQGEGVWVGVRQLFVRFAGCHLRCAYCDTPNSVSRGKSFQVLEGDGAHVVRDIPNPVNGSYLTGIIKGMASGEAYHSVAITGGEPLLQSEFLLDWLPDIAEMGLDIYLETSGDLHERFAPLAHFVDYCAMDVKLPSATHQPPKWADHSRFLQLALNSSVRIHVKAVVSEDTTTEEIERVSDIINACSQDIPLVLQPVTPCGEIRRSISLSRLRTLQRVALSTLRDVRIIPQTHKYLGAL